MSFQPLDRNLRLSDRVVEAILESVLSGAFPPGSRLPSERDLGEQFGVSRTVIREAVRSLVARGVLDVRPGSGVTIAAVDSSTIVRSMQLFLSARGMTYPMIHEVRSVLETQIARIAAERADGDDVVRLRAAADHMRQVSADPAAVSRADVAFHRELAHCTHNELFTVMLDSIGDVMLEIRQATLTVPGRAPSVLEAHDEILRRVAAGDADGAAAAMRAHLDESLRAWEHIR
jgi:GntR family transcriptional repressor for pyruvate dehydrogenase complex